MADSYQGLPSSDERGQKVRSIFAKIAPRYDSFNQVSSLGMHKGWLTSISDAAQAQPTDKVLDLAAGTGDVSFELCRACPPAHITCTDFCAEMLDVAKAREARGEGRGVPFTYAVVDAMNIPYENDSFDIVTVSYGLRNFADRAKAIDEAYRVLTPGGTYIALEFGTPPNPLWRGLYHVYLQLVVPAVGAVVAKDKDGFLYLRDSIKDFPPQAQIVKELEQAGFIDVSYKDRSGGIVAIYSATKPA